MKSTPQIISYTRYYNENYNLFGLISNFKKLVLALGDNSGEFEIPILSVILVS